MSDEVDRAQERAETFRTESLARATFARETAPIGDGICVDCDEHIPPARMAALNGRAKRCAFCEQQHETEGRR